MRIVGLLHTISIWALILSGISPLPPEDVNDVFRALVLPTLVAVWE